MYWKSGFSVFSISGSFTHVYINIETHSSLQLILFLFKIEFFLYCFLLAHLSHCHKVSSVITYSLSCMRLSVHMPGTFQG